MNIEPAQHLFTGSASFEAPCVPYAVGSGRICSVGCLSSLSLLPPAWAPLCIAFSRRSLVLLNMKILSFIPFLSFVLLADAITQRQTTLAFNQLQTWYNQSIGLWIPSTGWWNSANCLTVVADLAEFNPVVAAAAEDIYTNTYTEAQNYNLHLQKTVDFTTFLIHSHSSANLPKQHVNGFLNDYYDDEGRPIENLQVETT